MSLYKRYTEKGSPTKLDKLMHDKGLTAKGLYYIIKDISIEVIKQTGNKRFIAEVPQCAIQKIRSGQHKNPTVLTILKLCYALGCTPNDLIDNILNEEGEW